VDHEQHRLHGGKCEVRNRILAIIAISVVGAALIFFGFGLYLLSQPDIVTMVPSTPPPTTDVVTHSRDFALVTTVIAGVAVGLAALIAGMAASEMRE